MSDVEIVRGILRTREKQLAKLGDDFERMERAVLEVFAVLEDAVKEKLTFTTNDLFDLSETVLAAANHSECGDCGELYRRGHRYEPDDGGLCEPCGRAEARNVELTNRMNCTGTPYEY